MRYLFHHLEHLLETLLASVVFEVILGLVHVLGDAFDLVHGVVHVQLHGFVLVGSRGLVVLPEPNHCALFCSQPLIEVRIVKERVHQSLRNAVLI